MREVAVPTSTKDPTLHPPSRRERAEARRQQIVDAALRLFALQGYAATTTKSIAQDVGVTEGLIFHYFPTKADLLRAAAGQKRTFVGEVHALLSEAEGRPARDVLAEIVLGWVEAMRHQESLVTMLLVESQSNEELGQAFRGVVAELVDTMAAYLQGRVAAAELRADLPTVTSAMLFFSSLMMFFLTNRHLEVESWRRDAATFTAEMLDTWFRGGLPAGSGGEGSPVVVDHGGGG